MIHYFTTYGFKELGIYQESSVYYPQEKLDLPSIKDDIPLILIKALNAKEILEKIINLGSGIALSQETLDDIMKIIEGSKYNHNFIEDISNRELKALLYDYYNVTPSEPVEFLRHIVSKLTNESLIIKNKYLIEKIKESNRKFLDVLIKDAPDNLASIFFRFKPLFLAMKTISKNKTFFNQLRKKANKQHVPMPEDYLNTITSQIKKEKLDIDKFAKKIKQASIFRKIRLAYALNNRLHLKKSIVYRVRNGRGWATDFEWPSKLNNVTAQVLELVLTSIADDIRENVNEKVFYIPSNISYALPATEKQFTGNLPSGSYVSVPADLIVGIHWKNTKRQIDLDLSVIGETGKIGWDSNYRSKDNNVLFSGDVTDAPPPRGATELFYIKKNTTESRILSVNYYNFQDNDEVDCKILVAHENPKKFGSNYMVDVNNIIAEANIKISKKQSILGLIKNVDGENRIYFSNVSIGNSITSTKNTNSIHARNFLIGTTISNIDLREVLLKAGAIIVDEKPESDFFDLSPEALDKTTILDLIVPSK